MRKYKFIQKNSLATIVNDMLVDYPTPLNLSYLWNYGSLAAFCLIIQLLTGIFLAMHYTPHVDLAFSSVEHIMRDVNYGWFLRYLHANGASMFFIIVYIHLFRGLYYGSFLNYRKVVWIIGVIILLLMIITAFLGYVLPWGQMSFWAATVITNLVSTIPVIGEQIVFWLWGGFAVDNPTLNRFFSLHYLLPFVITGLVITHLIALHEYGSNNPLGLELKTDKIPFHPYFTVKDIYGIILFLLFFVEFVFFNSNYLGHPDNYIPANNLKTPEHIVPEWYFLPFYAILRSVPSKLDGVIAMMCAILVLLALPSYLNKVQSSAFRPAFKIAFWIFAVICLILGFLGGKPVEAPYLILAQLSTISYFGFIIVVFPVIGVIENKIFCEK